MSDLDSIRNAITNTAEGSALVPGMPLDGKPTAIQEVQATWTRYIGDGILSMKPRDLLEASTQHSHTASMHEIVDCTRTGSLLQ